MAKSRSLLSALVSMIPEMGEFIIDSEEKTEDIIWYMFHANIDCNLKRGNYIYRYVLDKDDDDFPYYDNSTKVTTEDGDIVVLYYIDNE